MVVLRAPHDRRAAAQRGTLVPSRVVHEEVAHGRREGGRTLRGGMKHIWEEYSLQACVRGVDARNQLLHTCD